MVFRLISLVAVFLVSITVAIGEELRDHGAFFHDSFGDLQEEAATALDEGKHGVLIMFETKDCPWCKRMKQSILNRASVQDYYHEYFRVISVDVEGDTSIINFDGEELLEKDFALKYNRVRATPVFAFFDSSGNFLTRFTGAAKTIDEFMLLAEYVVDGHYKNGRFSKFRRQQAKSS